MKKISIIVIAGLLSLEGTYASAASNIPEGAGNAATVARLRGLLAEVMALDPLTSEVSSDPAPQKPPAAVTTSAKGKGAQRKKDNDKATTKRDSGPTTRSNPVTTPATDKPEQAIRARGSAATMSEDKHTSSDEESVVEEGEFIISRSDS